MGIEPVGVHDDFFELGGHSLLASRIIARLRDMFPVDVPLNRLFESPTFSRLATVVREASIEKPESLTDEETNRLV